jgi:hypothetical protein
MSARYGAGDALRAGWAGLQASGMSTGQHNEYLRAIQRTLEDGIKKGFVQSSDQVVENLTMLANMAGNDPTWQGENGAKRLSDMNAGLENATGLQTTSDIVAFRAAREIAEQRHGGEPVSYVEAMKVMEEGLTPEMFSKYMSLTSSAEGGGYEGIVERMRQTFGMNYINADKLYQSWKINPNMNNAELEEYKKKPLPDARSPELEAAQLTARTANITVQTGQFHFDNQLPKYREELGKAEENLNDIRNGKGPRDISALPPEEGVEVRRQELQVAAEQAGTGSGMMGGGFGKLTQAHKNLQDAQKTAMQTSFGTGDVDSLRTRSTATVNSLFDTSLNLPKKEREANEIQQNKMVGTFGKALESGDNAQIQAVADVLKILESVPKEVREAWNADNTLNKFGDISDAKELLSALRGKTGYTAPEPKAATTPLSPGRDKAIEGFFDRRNNNDNLALGKLSDLEKGTRIDSPDYGFLKRAYDQLAAFETPKREEADRNDSLNAILKDNQITAQRLYEAVVELARKMDVSIVYE